MSGLTVKYKVKLKERRSRSKGDTSPPVAKPADSRRVSRAARMLALAHYVERLVESGELRSYSEAARKLGVTRARISQIIDLINLPPAVQEQILRGQLEVSERRLRELVREFPRS